MQQGTRMARARGTRALAVAVLLVLVGAACGDDEGSGSTPTTPSPVTSAARSGQPATTVVRGAPRWETVTTLTGTGPLEPPPFSILKDSIQWRARWKCDTGALTVTTDPPPRRAGPLVAGSCPGNGEGFAIVTGDVRLKIDAAGPWTVVVDQQIDTPLAEPPFEGMATAPVLRQGAFYNIEKSAKGTARLSKRADGATVLRLEDFDVTTNVDLFVWLSEAAAPKSSVDSVSAPHTVLGNLKSTLGNQNYVLPPSVLPEKVQSVIIWCEPVRQAYGAAALAP